MRFSFWARLSSLALLGTACTPTPESPEPAPAYFAVATSRDAHLISLTETAAEHKDFANGFADDSIVALDVDVSNSGEMFVLRQVYTSVGDHAEATSAEIVALSGDARRVHSNLPPSARAVAIGAAGHLLVALTKEGEVLELDASGDAAPFPEVERHRISTDAFAGPRDVAASHSGDWVLTTTVSGQAVPLFWDSGARRYQLGGAQPLGATPTWSNIGGNLIVTEDAAIIRTDPGFSIIRRDGKQLTSAQSKALADYGSVFALEDVFVLGPRQSGSGIGLGNLPTGAEMIVSPAQWAPPGVLAIAAGCGTAGVRGAVLATADSMDVRTLSSDAKTAKALSQLSLVKAGESFVLAASSCP